MTVSTVFAAADRFAMAAVKVYAEALEKQGIGPTGRFLEFDLRGRRALVTDCYLTGVVEALKQLTGDLSPEPWADEVDYKGRIEELLAEVCK